MADELKRCREAFEKETGESATITTRVDNCYGCATGGFLRWLGASLIARQEESDRMRVALEELYREAYPHLFRTKGEPRARQKTLKAALDKAEKALNNDGGE